MSDHESVELLLVEDNSRDAEVTIRSLKKHHLANRVVHVKDGQQALEWLFGQGEHAGRDRHNKPKVVLLDLKLPKVSGLEVLQAIRANEQTKFLPIVVLTSSQEEKDVIESYRLGVNSYIVKPGDFENFSAAVAAAGHYWLLVNHEPK